MSRENLIFNTIFYICLTLFFIYIFINEKKLVAKMEVKRTKLEDRLVNKLNIQGKTSEKILRKISKWTEGIITALVLVLIIQRFYLGNFLVPTGSMIPTIVPKDRLFGNMVIYKFKAPKREDIAVFEEPIEDKVLYTKRVMGLPGETVSIKDGRLHVNNQIIEERAYSDIGAIQGKEWTVPKMGDSLEIVPGDDYKRVYERKNIDIAEVQKLLKENSGYVSRLLPNVKFMLNGKETGMLLDYLHDDEVLNKLLNSETVKVTLDEDYYFMLGDNTDGSYDSRMWGFVKDTRIRGKAFIRFWPLNRIGLLN